MTAPANISKVERLRARDGDLCWLCQGKLHFNAVPNSKKAPTLEHLDAQANGGSDKLENLVLCHPGCDRQLGCRPKGEKLKIREKLVRSREKQLAARSPNAVAKAPKATSTTKASAKVVAAPAVATTPESAAQHTRSKQLAKQLAVWRIRALAGAGTALFFAGLSAGLLLAR